MNQKEVVTDVRIVTDFPVMNGGTHALAVDVHGQVMTFRSVQDVVGFIALVLTRHLLPPHRIRVLKFKRIILYQQYQMLLQPLHQLPKVK